VVERLQQIGQVVAAFVDSISAIAAGAIGAAANRVEQTLAGLLTLVISFLARIAGLGRVSDAVIGVVNKIRAPIDKALDKVIEWIVTMAKNLGKLVAQAGVPQDPNERLRLGAAAAKTAINRFANRPVGKPILDPVLSGIRVRYGFKILEPRAKANKWTVFGEINPTVGVDTDAEVAGILPLSPLTAAERTLIGGIPGGNAHLAKLDQMIAGKAQQEKIDAEVAVCRKILAILRQGVQVLYVGLEVFKPPKTKAFTEIDIITPTEMIEVKTGDYSREWKLSGRDMKQFAKQLSFFEGTARLVDDNGVRVNPPARFVYQFTKPISSHLYEWLKEKGVTEVRTAL
jgi:hypothetical protein